MAITSEIIGKLGGGDIETVPVGQFSDTDHVIHSFTLDKPSVVSAALTGLHETEGGTIKWSAPAPTIEVRPPNGGVWGVTQFGASLLSESTADGGKTNDSRFLSIGAVLPPGGYEIVINSQRSSRTYTVDTATIVTTPL